MTPSSKTFELWKAPPIPLTFDVYLYNWTNPRNFTKDDYEKPIVEQIGPYRFKEVPDKTNIRWHPRNSTISYRRRSTYYFDEENSVGKLDDRITTVNVVSLVTNSIFYLLNLFVFSKGVICLYLTFSQQRLNRDIGVMSSRKKSPWV